jgi:transcriptional regulator CtsR
MNGRYRAEIIREKKDITKSNYLQSACISRKNLITEIRYNEVAAEFQIAPSKSINRLSLPVRFPGLESINTA